MSREMNVPNHNIIADLKGGVEHRPAIRGRWK